MQVRCTPLRSPTCQLRVCNFFGEEWVCSVPSVFHGSLLVIICGAGTKCRLALCRTIYSTSELSLLPEGCVIIFFPVNRILSYWSFSWRKLPLSLVYVFLLYLLFSLFFGISRNWTHTCQASFLQLSLLQALFSLLIKCLCFITSLLPKFLSVRTDVTAGGAGWG